MDSIEDMVYLIMDEINSDISYVNSKNNENAQFLTGIEVAIMISTGILSAFFTEFFKSFATEIGNEAAKATIIKLKQVNEKITSDLKKRKHNREVYQTVQEYLPSELLNKVSIINKSYEYTNELIEIKDFLINNNFSEDKAEDISKKTIRILTMGR